MNRTSAPKKGRAGGKHSWLLSVFLIFISCFAVLALLSYLWMRAHFAGLDMQEIVVQLTSPLEGTGDGLIKDYVQKALAPALILLAIEIVLILRIFHRPWFRRFLKIGIVCSLLLVLTTGTVFADQVELVTYLKGLRSETDFYQKNYVDPSSVRLTFPEKKRNLIFIYLESMESSFSSYENGGSSKVNYIPELTRLAKENEDFSGSDKKLNGGYAMPGSTWTMGGIVATTAGLPLKTAADDNAMSSMSSFFPKLTALGDILKDAGYQQLFQCGSDVSFGGRRLWFSNHGSSQFLDLNAAKDAGLLPQDYKVFWGYEDQKLFEFAKSRISKMAAEGEPFSYTMLTVDTHASNGYRCSACPTTYGFQYGNALACSSKQVSAFIDWIRQQDFYKDTTIVITGDHPSMAPAIAKKMKQGAVRKTYTCVINPAVQVKDPAKKRAFTTYDLFPTTLAALGVKIPGDRLGLGTDLFSKTETLTEKYGLEEEKAELSKTSSYLKKLESIDPEAEKIVADYAAYKGKISVRDGSHFSFRLPELTRDTKRIRGMKVRVWYYDEQGRYVHTWLVARKEEDGSWTAENNGLDCSGQKQVSYQILAVTDYGTVNMGKEGVLNLSGYTAG